MPLTTPKSQTYSNPSWTMAIASKPSPLSRWWGQSLAQISEFSLEFKLVEESSAADSVDSVPAVRVRGNHAQLESLSHLTESYVQRLLVPALATGQSSPTSLTVAADEDPAFPDDAPEWQTDAGYRHRLYLGSLQVEPLMSELKVTTSQLYDLAEILQESLKTVQPRVVRELPVRSPVWPKTAAVAACAIGLTSGLAWWVVGGPSFQTASEPEQDLVSLDSPPKSNAPQGSNKNNLELPPTFQIKPTKPPTSKPGSQTQDLPATRKPQTNLSPSLELGTSSVKRETDAKQTPTSETTPSISKSRKDAQGKTATSETSTVIALGDKESKPVAAKPAPSQDSIKDSNPPSSSASNEPKDETTSSGVASSESVNAEASDSAADQVAIAPAPQVNQPAGLTAPPPAPALEKFSAARRQGALETRTSSAPSADTVLTFFQSQWRGQDSLDQSLSYRITVQPDGTVSAVTPQNDLASAQIEQTPVPPAGAPLVDPFSGPNAASFEVTLYPDGTVSVK